MKLVFSWKTSSLILVVFFGVLFFSVFFARAQSTGPIDYYPFDSGTVNTVTGAVTDAAGASNGTVFGATSANIVTGRVGQALLFAGSQSKGSAAQYVAIPGLPLTFSSSNSFTISVWINTVATVNQVILGRGLSSSGTAEIELYDNSGVLEATVGGARHYTGVSLPTNTWTNIVLTNNGATGMATVYVNGVQAGSPFASGTVTTPNTDFLIGSLRATNNTDTAPWSAFQGSIDEVKIFNYAFSAAQTAGLYSGTGNSGTPPPSSSSTTSANQNQSTTPSSNPTANPDSFVVTVPSPQTLTLPITSILLNATTTINGLPASAPAYWSQVSGPSQISLTGYGSYGAIAEGFVPGTYVFAASSSAHNGALQATATTTVTVLGDTTPPGDVSFTADTFVPPYSGNFGYGSNPGYYPGWSSSQVYKLIAQSGGHSMRTSQPDYYVSNYGYAFDLPSFKYADSLGLQDNVLLVGSPSNTDQDTTMYDGVQSKLWQGIYLPIWGNGVNGTPINPNNTFAVYIYNLVHTYGPYIKFWEIVNEPDFTYGWSAAMAGPTQAGNWWTNMPDPAALTNIHAPVTAYVRVLRIAYEIIKKYYPNAYVCPGGLGYPSFLDAVLRYTDNPNGGTATSDYPLTGGAYMDCLSWHIYPQYSVSHWDTKLGVVYTRYSDYLANTLDTNNQAFLNVLDSHGYNGTKYPAKPVIVTENNVASKEIGGGATGGIEMQRNFAIKELVEAQRIGLLQMYWFQTGDTGDYDTAASPFDLMGLYDNLTDHAPGTESMTDEGVANLTTSDLLYGWVYDAAQSTKLNLPSSVDGAAFSKNGQYRYVLWAKTSIDDSEAASATYSFPAAFGFTSLTRVEWNYATTHTSTSANASGIALTGSPSFFIPTDQTLPLQGSTMPPPPSNSSSSSNSSNGGSVSSGGTPSPQSGGSSGVVSSGTGGVLSVPSTRSVVAPSQTNTSQTAAAGVQNDSIATSARVSVTTPVLNVRSAPGGTIIGRVTPKDIGTVLWSSPATPWEEVAFSNGLSGFVYNAYLTGTSASVAAAQTISITTSALNVRTSPGGTIIGRVTPKDTGTLLLRASVFPWIKAAFDNGLIGYVDSEYTSLAASSAAVATVATETLRVRSIPNGTIIGKVHFGQQGTLQSSANGWSKISFGTITGYVSDAYITKQ